MVPAPLFEPHFDAEALRNALKDDVDDEAIINVLTKRSNRQRLEIAAEFKKLYGKVPRFYDVYVDFYFVEIIFKKIFRI